MLFNAKHEASKLKSLHLHVEQQDDKEEKYIIVILEHAWHHEKVMADD